MWVWDWMDLSGLLRQGSFTMIPAQLISFPVSFPSPLALILPVICGENPGTAPSIRRASETSAVRAHRFVFHDVHRRQRGGMRSLGEHRARPSFQHACSVKLFDQADGAVTIPTHVAQLALRDGLEAQMKRLSGVR